MDIRGVIAGLAQKPANCHVILAGSGALPELIEIAALVPEMELIKRPFRQQGVRAHPGMEF
ncbi:Cob(I)yrinic acid a,c-diamide adenosyltransferase [Microcystis aeruginosa SPC777]|uniref:Cob(I)yrinic acid a,c-diamide adenosyltransferase n=1 Tax=Microcystis aeruginosa SPC777 TaxID=482300 RepID=S3JCM5_MICAE|nr:Cob(I)yrinic acid a,c-diamide adenosyltransferase [Microcystis aeruginosa SPC777]